MSYTESLLVDGEVIAKRAKQHWLSLFLDGRNGVGLWIIAAILFAASIFFNIQGDIRNVIGWIILVLVVLGVIIFAWHWLRWLNQDYVVTNRRILQVSGIVNKKSADSSLEKINDLVLQENLLGRMLGYGDLDIVTASDVAIDRFRMLKDAKAFRREMMEQKHALEQGDFYKPSPPLTTTSPGQAYAPPEADDETVAGTTTAAVAADAAVAEAPVAEAPVAEAPADVAPAGLAEAGTVEAATEAAEDDEARDVTRTLARLADLRDRGAISPEDYEAKKNELLSRL